MTDEEKKALENNSGENQNQNQDPDKDKEIERLKKEADDSKEDARIAREDSANYQSEADIAKGKLDDKDQLNVREEGVAEREHKLYVSEIQRDYPDVFSRFPEVFESLKGNKKEEYVTQAEYLQQGIKKGENPVENKPAENAGDNNKQINNDEANPLPESGQNNQSKHIFTRAELAEHAGDIDWFNANEAEINRQTEEGLIK